MRAARGSSPPPTLLIPRLCWGFCFGFRDAASSAPYLLVWPFSGRREDRRARTRLFSPTSARPSSDDGPKWRGGRFCSPRTLCSSRPAITTCVLGCPLPPQWELLITFWQRFSSELLASQQPFLCCGRGDVGGGRTPWPLLWSHFCSCLGLRPGAPPQAGCVRPLPRGAVVRVSTPPRFTSCLSPRVTPNSLTEHVMCILL
jgi:hypothetical protein